MCHYCNWIISYPFMCNVSSLSPPIYVPGVWNLIIEGGVLIWLAHNSPLVGCYRISSATTKDLCPSLYVFFCISNFLVGWKKWDSNGIDRRGDVQSYLIIMHGWCCLIMNVWYPSGVCSSLSLSHVVCRSLSPILWGLLIGIYAPHCSGSYVWIWSCSEVPCRYYQICQCDH